MSLRDKVDRVEKEYSMGGDFYKFAAGEHKIRVLVEPVDYEDFLNGESKVTWLTYIVSRPGALPGQDGQIHACNLPHGIVKYLADLEADPDFDFKSYPAPFELKVTVTGAGIQKRYEKAALPKTAIDPVIVEQLAEVTPLEDLKDKLATKAQAKRPAEPRGQFVAPLPKGEALTNFGMAIQNAVGQAKDADAVHKAADMLKIAFDGKQLDEREATMLKKLINARLEEFGEVVIGDDDLPF